MTSRRRARRQAIDVLYQADVTGADVERSLAEWHAAGREIDLFAEELVEGVTANRAEIDDVLSAHSEHWTVDRMASLDRTILRVAVFELLHRPDVPPAAAISEAVEIAKELSTEESGRFVNGILGKVAAQLDPERGPEREQPDPA